VNVTLRIFISKNQFENELKKREGKELMRLLSELVAMNKFEGVDYENFDYLLEEEPTINRNNFKRFFVHLHWKEIEKRNKYIEDLLDNIEDSRDRDIIKLFLTSMIRELEELMENIATPIDDLILTYYFFPKKGKVPKDFISVSDAIVKVIEKLKRDDVK